MSENADVKTREIHLRMGRCLACSGQWFGYANIEKAKERPCPLGHRHVVVEE